MTRADILAAIDLLPRYNVRNRKYWTVDGTRTFIRGRQMDVRERRMIDRLAFKGRWIKGDVVGASHVEWVKPNLKTLRLTHGNLRPDGLIWLAKRNFQFNNWRKHRLPFFVRYAGRMFLLNGHHRCALCRLARRPLRARVTDL